MGDNLGVDSSRLRARYMCLSMLDEEKVENIRKQRNMRKKHKGIGNYKGPSLKHSEDRRGTY